MKLTRIKFLPLTLIILAVLFIALNIFKGFTSTQEYKSVKIVQPKEEIADSQYIISKKTILTILQSKAQIVSLQQEIEKTYTDVDKQWNGDRYTTIHIIGKYKMGLDTSEIEVKHIDSNAGILYIKLGEPKLISLEIPYDRIQFTKEKGMFRTQMNDEEKKEFYKVVEKDIRNQILSDDEILKQANLYNQEVIKELLNNLAGVKHISFE